MPNITATVEMCFGARVRQLYVDAGGSSGYTAVWPLDDTFGTVVRELVGDRVGTSVNVSLSDPGYIPEFGSVTGFNGTTATISVAHSAAFAPVSTLAIAMIVKLVSITAGSTVYLFDKGNGSGKRIEIKLTESAGDLSLAFTMNIGGAAQTLTELNIGTSASWIASPRFVVCRYDGSNMIIKTINVSTGVVTSWGTVGVSGAVDVDAAQPIYLASKGGATNFAAVGMQWVAWWADTTISDAELTTIGNAVVWTDVTADVVMSSGVLAEWGNRSTGPYARIGSTGTMQFALNNGPSNSGGLVGYYSPDHANVRTGFGFGNMVRFSVTDPTTGTTWRRFVGQLVGITPLPGTRMERLTECLAVDYFDNLARTTLPSVALGAAGLRTEDAMAKLIQRLPVHPHDLTSGGGTSELFLYGYDAATDEVERVLPELGRLADSEMGYIYLRGNTTTGGQLTLDLRQTRLLKTTADWTLSDSMQEMTVERTRDNIYNHAQVLVLPRTVDAAATTVLFTLDVSNQQPSLQPGASITLRAPYTDATNAASRAQRVGGTAIVTPVATTDYTANTAADGSGSDGTSSLSVTFTTDAPGQAAEAGANSALLLVTNNNPVLVYVTKLQLRGKGVYSYKEVVCEARDETLRAKYGDTSLVVSQPYQDVVDDGVAAANYLLAGWKQERTLATALTLRVSNSSPTARITAAIAGDCGDLVALTETVSGIAAKPYFINGVAFAMKARNQFETRWTMQPVDMGTSWILGVTGRSELGTTTGLGM